MTGETRNMVVVAIAIGLTIGSLLRLLKWWLGIEYQAWKGYIFGGLLVSFIQVFHFGRDLKTGLLVSHPIIAANFANVILQHFRFDKERRR